MPTARRTAITVAIWFISALLIAALGWYLLLRQMDRERQEAEENALHEASIIANAYSHHLLRSLEAIDQIILYVKYGYEMSNGLLSLEQVQASALFRQRSGIHLSVVNARGRLVTTTIPDPREDAVENEPFFAYHRSHVRRGDELYIGRAQPGPFSNQTIFPFSRPLNGKDGAFEGIVLASVVPEYFISGYDNTALQNNGYLGVFGLDKRMRLARIGSRVAMSRGNETLPASLLDGDNGATLVKGRSFFSDGRPRYLSWKRTEQYGMIAVAALDQQEALAAFEEKRAAAIKDATMASMTLAVLALAGAFTSLRLHRRKHEIERLSSTYRTATEGGMEGFFIASPVQDGDGQIVDFIVSDCNARGAEYLRYRPEELKGRRVCEIFEGEACERTLRMLRHAMRQGVYEGEAELRHFGGLEGRWVHIKIARPEYDLAVTMRDITSAKEQVSELEKRGNEDPLTGLPNRHWLNGYLPRLLSQADASDGPALLFIDLDGFKAVNDTSGHESGDEVLRIAGRRLQEAVRPHDRVVRTGGDEFLVVLERVSSPSEAAHVAERVMTAFQPPFRTTGGSHCVGTSIGIACFPADGSNADLLLQNADTAMYAAKTAGKRGYRFYDPRYSEVVQQRHRLEEELRRALDEDQLVVHYQPRVDAATGRTCSMEALVRWHHPARGMVAPSEFIALAEETRMIVPLGEQVLAKVCAQLAEWAQAEAECVPVSINVSPLQLRDGGFVESLRKATQGHGVSAGLLEIEITESAMMQPDDQRVLHQLQDLGCRLLVDDFGSGFSSLSQLQDMDFDVLKVDRAFTRRLNSSPQATVLYSAIINMAHAMGMRVVAEGVESLQQLSELRRLGCDEVQGFLISAPVPAPGSMAFLRGKFLA